MSASQFAAAKAVAGKKKGLHCSRPLIYMVPDRHESRHSWVVQINTGWREWRYARGSAAIPFDDADPAIKEAAKVGKCVAGSARLLDRFGLEVYQKAAQVLWAETLEVDSDAVRLGE